MPVIRSPRSSPPRTRSRSRQASESGSTETLLGVSENPVAPNNTPKRRRRLSPPPPTGEDLRQQQQTVKQEQQLQQRQQEVPEAPHLVQRRVVLEAEQDVPPAQAAVEADNIAQGQQANPILPINEGPLDIEMDGQAGGENGAGGNAAIRMPPALQNWEAFSQALFGHRPALPEFYGLDHEDPENYLDRCTEYIEAFNLPERQRVRALEKGLKGDADKWWQCYRTMGIEWPRFQELIRTRFDSQNIKSNLVAQLYGRKQGDKEDIGPFLQQKYMLYQRVRPDEPEATRVTTLVSLMRPTLKRAMRAHEFADFSELLAKALEAERDEEEEHLATKTKARKESPEDKPKAAANREGGQSMPKCWHCPEKHWHRDCPVFKEKQSGNWRGAAQTPAASAQDDQARK